MIRFARIAAVMGVLALNLAMPMSAFAAEKEKVACKAVNLLTIGGNNVNLVELSDDFCTNVTKGPASIIVTGLNILALLMIALVSIRMMSIFAKALMEFNKDELAKDDEKAQGGGSGQKIVQAALMSALETFVLAVIGYVAITRGANFLLDLAVKMGEGFCEDPAGCSSEAALKPYFGNFTGLVVKVQNAFAYGILIIGLVLIGNRWRIALSKRDFSVNDTSATKVVRATFKESAMITIVVVAAFWSVLQGPMVFNKTIRDFGKSSECTPGSPSCQ